MTFNHYGTFFGITWINIMNKNEKYYLDNIAVYGTGFPAGIIAG